MIDKKEIEQKSEELGVNTSDVQRDYIFGWILSGIYNGIGKLDSTLILKGGNCFRKAYFENARYSNDLDFSTQSEIDPIQLQEGINKVCQYIGDMTGISFALEQNRVFPKKTADKDDKIYEARVYFKGFYGEESYNIKAKLDISEFDRIYLPLQTRNLIHSYSDFKECQAEIRCLKLEELLALKLRALLQRLHSPDLYDFVYSVFFQNGLVIKRIEVINTFLKKTIYEPEPVVAKNLLLELPFQTIKALWNKYLVCPKISLISFEDAEEQYKSIITALFELLTPAARPVYAGAYSLDYFPARYRSIIMEAGRTKTLLRLMYDGYQRLVEPYALTYKIRKDRRGREYFYAWDRSGGRSGQVSIKSFIHSKVQSLEHTEQKFEPRFPIELTKTGEIRQANYFSKPFSGQARTGRSVSRTRARYPTGVEYTIECPYCGKRFKRSKYSTKLNKHKDHYGNLCYGRTGFLV